VTADNHYLRLALAELLKAKRALRRAYRRVYASDVTDGWMPTLESGPTTGQTRVESLPNEELDGLKDDNERLRRTLSVLHIHSLRLREQRDRLRKERDELVIASAAIGGCVRADPRMEKSSSSSPG
jgi:hypothetical protein